jgi:hypothetical protein
MVIVENWRAVDETQSRRGKSSAVRIFLISFRVIEKLIYCGLRLIGYRL